MPFSAAEKEHVAAASGRRRTSRGAALPRPVRTSLFAVVGLTGALLGMSPASATPDGAVALFEPVEVDSPAAMMLLGQTSAGIVYMQNWADGIVVKPTGGAPVADANFMEPEVVGSLITEHTGPSTISWRTIADPTPRTHTIADDVEYGVRTATGYVGVRGSGPYEIVRVDMVAGGTSVLGTSSAAVVDFTASSAGVAVMSGSGRWRYYAFGAADPANAGKIVPTPTIYMECPWLSRSHLFCEGFSGIYRISVSTGATSSTSAAALTMVETAAGVAYLDVIPGAQADELVLRTWDTSATAPTTRVPASFALDGSLTTGVTGSSVLVGRTGPLGRAGFWTVPLPSGTTTQAMAAPPAKRSAGWHLAVGPGAVAWADNLEVDGVFWTRDLAADGTPTGENERVADGADAGAVSTSAGRFTYSQTVDMGGGFFWPDGTRLVDGESDTLVDEEGWAATLSGDRLLSEAGSFFGDSTYRLRDLRTGEVTTLPAAMDYDLWGERLVRLEETGRVTVTDLRAGGAPVVLRAASSDPEAFMWGTVHVAGDVVAWDVLDMEAMTEDRAIRNLDTMAAATQLPEDLMTVDDLSTGYVTGAYCGDPCYTVSIPVADPLQPPTDLEVDTAVVDGNVVAGIDSAGVPSVQKLPVYADAPRLLGEVDASSLAGPGRTWQARVVASRVLSACTVEIRDGADTVVRSLDCTDRYAAKTVTWDGEDGDGAAVPAGEYTWTLTGAAGAEDLVDYDGTATALTGTLTVSDVPAPTATVVPADDARKVAQTDNVTATFTEAVTGVSGTSFRLKGPDGATVPAAVTYDAAAKKATLNPTATLAADTRYTATLTGAIEGGTGGPIQTTSWTFTTGPAPSLTSLAPGTNGTSATLSGNLTAVFSEAVTGLSTDTFQLADPDGNPVAGAVTYAAATRTATFNPTANLLPDTRYTATLTGGNEAVRDLAGNPLNNRVWSFTTGPAPTVSSYTPAANATNVGRTANVVAAFSEPVTGVSSTTVKLKTSSGTTVSAAVSYSTTSRKVTINPTSTLAAKTKYTVTLTGGTTAIRDAAGNPLTTKTWSFTTGS